MDIITQNQLNAKPKPLTFSERYVNDYARWLKQDKFNWSYAGTYRPKKTKVTNVNALRLLRNTIENYCRFKRSSEAIKYLYYTLEQDSSRSCNHLHFVIDSSSKEVNRNELAAAMKRHKTKELLYFEPIQNIEGYINYITKRIANKSLVTGHNLLVTEQIEDNYLKNKFPNYKSHENEKYHERAKIFSKVLYGWIQI